MDDQAALHEDWDAGFIPGSQVVVAQMGPYQHIFQRPPHYRQRFHHKIYDLTIEDWRPQALERELGGVCRVEVGMTIRFQPVLAYIQAYPECVEDVGSHVRSKFQPLIDDQAELVVHGLENGDWLDKGCGALERRLNDAIQVTMAVHHLRCRCLSHIHTHFDSAGNLERITPLGLRLWERHLVQQRARADEEAQRQQERLVQEQAAQRLQLEHQTKLLEMERATRQMEREAQQWASETLKIKLFEEETRLREQMRSEAQRYQEQLQHEQELKKLKLEGEMEDLQQRLRSLDEKDDCVKRELELLYLEKQRLLLQEEVLGLKQSWLARGGS